MRCKINILIVLLVFYSHVSYAVNIDALMHGKINIPKPFLVINIRSGDCIMCRVNVVTIIDKMKLKVPDEKIILLSDEPLMGSYFAEYPEIFAPYTVIFDAELSNALAKESGSTVCLIREDTILKYDLGKITEKDFMHFDSILSYFPPRKQQPFVEMPHQVAYDTLFPAYFSDFSLNNDYSIFFNNALQVGVVYDMSLKESLAMRTQISSRKYAEIMDIVDRNTCEEYVDTTTALKILQKAGLPKALIRKISSINDDCILFYLNTVYYRGDKDDDALDVGIRKQCFMGVGKPDPHSILNIDSYSHFFLIDTFHYLNNAYVCNYSYGYQISTNKVFMFFTPLHTALSSEEPYLLVVAALGFALEHKKAALLNVFPVHYPSKTTNDLSVYLDDNDAPFIINERAKTIQFQNEIIEYSKLFTHGTDTITSVFDAVVENHTLRLIGQTNNIIIKCQYHLINKETKTEKLCDSNDFDTFSFAGTGSNIIACKRKKETNEISFEMFEF